MKKNQFMAMTVLLALWNWSLVHTANPLDFLDDVAISDIVSIGAKTGEAVIENIPQPIPALEELLKIDKNIVFGLPQEVIVESINIYCTTAIAANATQPKKEVDISKMNYVLLTATENVTVPILESERLWSNENFNKEWPVVIFVPGWLTDINEPNAAIDTMYSAYAKRGNNNFIVLDTARYLDTLYSWASLNTLKLSEGLAMSLKELVEMIPIENIHLIGHSLGAHTVGGAGFAFQRMTNRTLPRITALDPANPCFREGHRLNGISRGAAKFVDIIHTNAGVAGMLQAVGDADFYVNGYGAIQPGCFQFPCSHSRAWELYANTVEPGFEHSMLATRCNLLLDVKFGKCNQPPISMGYACPSDAIGRYFLETNAEYPFGKNT